MPNLKPSITTVDSARTYQAEILQALEGHPPFQPLMTLYLTESMTVEELQKAKDSGMIFGVKYYPAGVTTNSQDGVSDIRKVHHLLQAMERLGIPLLIHGEDPDPQTDVFDRETVFFNGNEHKESTAQWLVTNFPHLKISFEHITTADAVAFVQSQEIGRVMATVTPQHMLLDRNHMLGKGIQPHRYCMPILKRRHHQEAVLDAVASGDSRFAAGTDSAPHATGAKEAPCGCAGCFTAPHAIPLYLQALASVGALDQAEAFLSRHFAHFHGLPLNEGTVTFEQVETPVPASYDFGNGQTVTPLQINDSKTVEWRRVA